MQFLHNKKRLHLQPFFVPSTGFEPAHSFELHPLKMACLPISPTGQELCKYNQF